MSLQYNKSVATTIVSSTMAQEQPGWPPMTPSFKWLPSTTSHISFHDCLSTKTLWVLSARLSLAIVSLTATQFWMANTRKSIAITTYNNHFMDNIWNTFNLIKNYTKNESYYAINVFRLTLSSCQWIAIRLWNWGTTKRTIVSLEVFKVILKRIFKFHFI